MRTPESIISDENLRKSVRYAAARGLIEAGAHNRKEKRELKFYILSQLGGVHKKGVGEHRDFVVFPDNTKAVF